MAAFPEFIGGSGRAASTQADAERAINWYVENIDSRTGRTKATRTLRQKPGLSALCVLPNATSIAGMCSANGRVFVVAAGSLWELQWGGGFIQRGAVGQATTQQNTALCASQTQVLVLVAGNGFIFNLATNTLTAITSDGWVAGSVAECFIDAYFLVLEPNSQQFAISGLNDGTSWDPLDFGAAEGEQGNIVDMKALSRQLWLLGNTHSEVYYDSGNANFPFSRLDGAFMEQGSCAQASSAVIDNTLMWLGGNRDGQGILWRANGYTPERVSTHAMESAIQKYSTISDAISYPYQEDGHTFLHVSFPSANNGRGWTWCYDVASGEWHERASWQASQGQWYDDLARLHCFGFGMHLVGDWRSGTVYVQSMTYPTDNGAPIRRERITPSLSQGLGKFIYFGELRIACEVGIGQAGSTGSTPTPAYVQSISNSFANNDTPTVTLSQNTTAGNSIVLSVVYSNQGGAALQSISDSQGNSYELLLSSVCDGGYTANATPVLVYVAKSIKGGACTVTAHFSSGNIGVSLAAHEYAGLGIASYAAATRWPNTTHANNMTMPTLNVAAGSLVFLLVADTALGAGSAYSVSPSGPTSRQATGYSFNTGFVPWSGDLCSFDVQIPSAAALTYTLAQTSGANADALAAAIVFGYQSASGVPPPVVTQVAYQDPQLILTASDDGGKTYGPERPRSMGQVGEYETLVRWQQNGRSNNRVYRVVCTEPNQVTLIGAEQDY